MLLKQLLLDCPDIQFKSIAKQFTSQELEQLKISKIVDDSREQLKDACFVAIKGSVFDGHSVISKIQNQKVKVIFLESLSENNIYTKNNILFIPVKNTRQLLSNLLYAANKKQLSKIKVVGITGTNGKTSISYLLEFLLRQQKEAVGVMGTLDHHINNKIWKNQLTSPSVFSLYDRLKDFNKEKMKTLVMEVSSHALSQSRVEAFPFSHVVFSNLTQDHLDYHKNFENYFKAKQKLFLETRDLMQISGEAFINTDDPYAKKLKISKLLKVWTYGQNFGSDFLFKVTEAKLKGMQIELNFENKKYTFFIALIGLHNAYNVIASLAVAYRLGYDIKTLTQSFVLFKAIPGRLQKVENDFNKLVFIDYAHTPDAISSVLSSLKPLAEKISIVFGCGGDRDKLKRPLMLNAALKFADFIVLTSDNPRGEKEEDIIADILAEKKLSDYKKKIFVVLNREEAIKLAINLQNKNDILVIAGKGHEKGQILKNKNIPWDDYTASKRLLQNGKAK